MPPYKLCFIDSIRSWGGAEVWFLETALALRARGLDVEIIAQPDSELQRRARAARVPSTALPIRFDVAPWTVTKLARIFREHRITSVVANLTKDFKTATVSARFSGTTRVWATRESDAPLKDKPYYRWFFNRLGAGVLVNSEATRRTVLDSAPWLDPARVHLLYKGIDTDRFRPAPDPAATSSPPVVGFVGQLIERKGLATIMEAWSLLEAMPPSTPRLPQLHIAGQGPMRDRLESWRGTLKHPDTVQILGLVEPIEPLLQGLAMLLLPSSQEGFGLAAAEASACGVPVIAANASSLPEVVADGRSGLLVPVGNAQALAKAMKRLLEDPELAAKMGLAGRQHVIDRYPREATLRRLLQLTGGPDAFREDGRP